MNKEYIYTYSIHLFYKYLNIEKLAPQSRTQDYLQHLREEEERSK